MKGRCEKEVIELHRFFEDWFMGRLDDSEQEFSRFENVMAEDFTMIPPEGAVTQRADLLAALRKAHGAHVGEGSISIRVVNIQPRQLSDDHWLVTYEEWQTEGRVERGRISSALFGRRSGTPNDVEWLHVHETWLPEFPQR